MDAATRVPDFDEVRRELDEVREEMIRAIAEARAKSEIVEIFLRANQVSIDATVRSRKKNSTSHYAFREIALRADRLRGQWLKDFEKAGRRFMGRPEEGVKIGTPPDQRLVVLDDLGLGGNTGRRESQDLQLLADMPPEAFEVLVADPDAPRPRWGPEKRILSLSEIRADKQAQPRAALDTDRVAEYVEAMVRGEKFPRLVLFQDKKGRYWLADGFHRFQAAVELKRKAIECIVYQGELRDAILFSCGANATHGLPRTNADKRQAVTKLLSDEKWAAWNDSEIARRCHVSDHLVATIRKQRAPVHHREFEDRPRTVSRGGTTYTQETANIGRSRAPDPEPEKGSSEQGPEQPQSALPPQTAPDQPASAPEAWARERAAVRDAIRGLLKLKLKDVDFDLVVATMSIEELREAHTEVQGRESVAALDEAFNAVWEWVEALERAIKSAAVEERKPPAPVAAR
jgi:hypothetical protein